jgi:hypothetical protein
MEIRNEGELSRMKGFFFFFFFEILETIQKAPTLYWILHFWFQCTYIFL